MIQQVRVLSFIRLSKKTVWKEKDTYSARILSTQTINRQIHMFGEVSNEAVEYTFLQIT